MAWLHFWPICTFFNNETFFKKFEIFFRFLWNPKGPFGWKKIEFFFLKKILLIKFFRMLNLWRYTKNLKKISMYWSGLPNNPRGWEKKGSFLKINFLEHMQPSYEKYQHFRLFLALQEWFLSKNSYRVRKWNLHPLYYIAI